MTAWMILALTGRTLLALLFILAGVVKVIGPKPFLDHMAQEHVPKVMLPLVILLELGGGALVLLGWKLEWSALALGLFCVATALVFHRRIGDRAERTLFVKDLAIAGGLFVLAAQATG